MRRVVGTLLLVAGIVGVASCGPNTSPAFVNWQNHVTVRTCVVDPDLPAPEGTRLCSGYQKPADVRGGAITDVHYAVIQIERVYFRDLPEWTRNAEVSVDVSIRGLLPGGKEYRQVLDIVNVTKESYLQIQNVSINFPIRFQNRIVSLQFSIRELDNPAEAKKWFEYGKGLLDKVKSSPLAGGFLGAVLLSEVTEDIASVVIDQLASDDHVFALKQVDFLTVANTTGPHEQLLFTQGRYVVVAVPPADTYDLMKSMFGTYPEQLDRQWLLANANYEGGYLLLKEGNQNYLYTPYVSFNFAVLKRYADKSQVVDNFQKASRALELGQVDQAEAFLALASASFMADAGFSFKKELKNRGAELDTPGKKGLLEMSPNDLIDSAEKIMNDIKKAKFDSVLGLLQGKVPGLGGDGGAGDAKETEQRSAALSMEEEEGVYTQLEYSFFIDFLKALTAELQLAKASAKAAVGPDVVIPVLEMYVAVKLNNQELPLFNSECEILKRSVNRLWGQVKAGYNIPMTVKVQAGQELSDLLSGQGDGKTAVYNTLLRVQSEVDFVVEKCLDQKSEAY